MSKSDLVMHNVPSFFFQILVQMLIIYQYLAGNVKFKR